MAANVLTLGEVVMQTLHERRTRELTYEESSQFYREFNNGIGLEIEKIRETRRKASEELKNLTLA